MIKNQNELLTIGQFASMHAINKKTLMWYDEIGLLKPYAIKDNGYRYYSYLQSSELENILLLKELNVPLKEIKEYLNNKTIDKLESIVAEQLVKVEQNIRHLRDIQKLLLSQQNDLKILKAIDVDKIEVLEKSDHYLVSVEADIDISFDKAVEMVMKETKKYQIQHLHDARYGSLTPLEYIKKDRADEYSAIFIELSNPNSKKGLHIQKAGKYLRTYYRGDYSNIKEKYTKILAYAEENKWQLGEYAYEMGINAMVAETIDDYITRIEIPIIKGC